MWLPDVVVIRHVTTQVLTTQWDYTKSEELAYDCPYQVLRELVIATGGWIVQRATVSTQRTARGKLMLTNEMDLLGIKDAPLPTTRRKINTILHGVDDLRPIRAPLTFVVGHWSGKLKLPPCAVPKGIPVELEEIHNVIRADMIAAKKRAKNAQVAREEAARAKAEESHRARLLQCKKEQLTTTSGGSSSSTSHRRTTSPALTKKATPRKRADSNNNNLDDTLASYEFAADLEPYDEESCEESNAQVSTK